MKENVTVEKINPSIAASWLEGQTNWRINLSARTVKKYSEEMKSGRWLLNGDAIRFDDSGVLLDGFHRLHAVIESGAEVDSFVIRGLDKSSVVTMDDGRRRGFGDYLHSGYGAASGKNAAACATLVVGYDSGRINYTGSGLLSRIDVCEFYARNKEAIDEAVSVGHSVYNQCYRSIPGSVSAAAYFIFSRIDSPLAAKWASLLSGNDPSTHHPVGFLRQMMISERTSKNSTTRQYKLALCIRSWNLMRDGRQIKNAIPMRIWTSGERHTPFPVAK